MTDQEIALAFTALAHHRRIKIARALTDHAPEPLSFDRLRQIVKMPASAMTHHLRVLENGRILRRRAVRQYTYFTLHPLFLAQSMQNAARLLDIAQAPQIWPKTQQNLPAAG